MKKGTITAIAGSLFLSSLFIFSAIAVAAPLVHWSPRLVATNVEVGGVKLVKIEFATTERLTDVDLVPVPALASYITVEPHHLEVVEPGSKVSTTLTVKLPADIAPGTSLDGVVQVRRRSKHASRVIPMPLPVVLTAVENNLDITDFT